MQTIRVVDIGDANAKGAAPTASVADVTIVAAEGCVPRYASLGAAGADLVARLDVPLTLPPGARAMVPTGVRIAVPPGFEAQVRPRSGLSAKHGVTVINAPGTVDSDYRGEILVPLVNLGADPFIVEPLMRIAQLVIAPVIQARFIEVRELSPTTRGEGGFGSTGHQ